MGSSLAGLSLGPALFGLLLASLVLFSNRCANIKGKVFGGSVPSRPILDAFVVNGGQASRIYANDGAGDFTADVISGDTGINFSHGVALGDLDGNGDLDAFVANYNSQANRIYTNGGKGNFTADVIVGDTGMNYSRGVALGDLDDDGDLDAFVVNNNAPNRIYTNKINKGMDFTVADIMTGDDRSSRGVALGDLDNDGNLDAFVVNGYGQVNRIYTNDRMGTGSFTAADIPTTLPARSSYGVALGDLDGDGDLDAFVVNSYVHANRIYTNKIDEGMEFIVADIPTTLPGRSSYGVALGDLDGDGDLDAFVVNSYDYGQANRIYINDGAGRFTVADIMTGDDRNSEEVALGDLDRDGDLDAFVVNYNAPNRIYTNDGKGNFRASDVSGDMGASTGVGLGDLGLE